MKRLLTLTAVILLTGCTVKELKEPVFEEPILVEEPSLAEVLRYEQNAYFLPPVPLLAQDDLDRYKEAYARKQFAPWEKKALRNSKEDAIWGLSFTSGSRQYIGENRLEVSDETLEAIREEANFDAHGTILEYAITVEESHLRVLPTDKPLFSKQTNGQSSYPFDYLQNSLLGIMQPLLISHYSKDRAWVFVESPFAAGWVKTSEIALIDEKLAGTIRDGQNIVITKDNAALYLENGLFAHRIKMGSILPLVEEDDENYKAFIVIPDASKRAKAVNVTISKSFAAPFPLEFNERNVKRAINELLGENYGWGGLYNNRDCSAMTKDFFSLFGIWLPRNSLSQKRSAAFTDVSDLTLAQKDEMLREFGIPYLTLVYMPGHIMLYAGKTDERALIFHNVWGLTNKKGEKFLIGKSVISDLFIGENLPDMEDKNLLISKIQGFSVFASKPALAESKLPRVYPQTIEKIANNIVYFKDGSELLYDDGAQKSYAQMLINPDIEDQFYETYTKGKLVGEPKNDAGRIRNIDFFKAMYGHDRQEIEQNLVEVPWLPSSSPNKTLLFNKKNGASAALWAVSNELDKLGGEYAEFLDNVGGTYRYQEVASSDRLIMHTFGIAIDLDLSKANYWHLDKNGRKIEDPLPQKIIDIFEKHGFIWGGKWLHYDTMHFEYRPELLR